MLYNNRIHKGIVTELVKAQMIHDMITITVKTDNRTIKCVLWQEEYPKKLKIGDNVRFKSRFSLFYDKEVINKITSIIK